jgi:hypothetical protein
VAARKVQGVRKKQAMVQRSQQKVQRSQKKVALYARTSSMANAAGHSAQCKFQAAASGLQRLGSQNKKINKVVEVISGKGPCTQCTHIGRCILHSQ